MPLTQGMVLLESSFVYFYSFSPYSFTLTGRITMEEKPLHPQRWYINTPFDVFFSWKMFLRIEWRAQEPLTLGLQEDC